MPSLLGQLRGRIAGLRTALAPAIATALLFASCTGSPPGSPDPSRAAATASASPGATQAPPPWPLPKDVEAAIRAAGLTPLSSEGEKQHTHSELQLWYGGARVLVPADIGIDEAAGTLSPVHTHDRSGIVHVESPEIATFRLGQLFTEWGVSLAGARAWVNGQAAADPATVVLVDRQMIVVAWGTPPDPIPASYTEGYYPGETIPDLVPGVTLHGLPSGFAASGVTQRVNGSFAYLAAVDDAAAGRERPLVDGTLVSFQVKEWTLQGQANLDLFAWQFDDAAAAQRYVGGSGVFVPGDPQAAPSVGRDARVWFGDDPQRTDGSTVGQVSWSSGSYAFVLLGAAAKGVLTRDRLVSLAAGAAADAASLASPAVSAAPCARRPIPGTRPRRRGR